MRRGEEGLHSLPGGKNSTLVVFGVPHDLHYAPTHIHSGALCQTEINQKIVLYSTQINIWLIQQKFSCIDQNGGLLVYNFVSRQNFFQWKLPF